MAAPQGIHLVGSMPFESAHEHFNAIGNGRLGPYLHSISDGEMAPSLRQNWVACQVYTFRMIPFVLQPFLEQLAEQENEKTGLDSMSEADLPAQLKSLEIGYDKWAIESYALFADLKSKGVLPKHLKFQVGIPSTTSVCLIAIKREYRAVIEPFYEAATLRALRHIQDSIPHGELLIQCELVGEFMFLEKAWKRANTIQHWRGDNNAPWFGTNDEEVREGMCERLDRITNKTSVDGDIAIGFHLCYGDYMHKHFLEPESAKYMADVTEHLISGSDRQVSYIHFPMPKEVYDETYLEHLRALWPKLQAGGTYLYVGLVHGLDLEGTKRRIEAAKKVFGSDGWGIASECGLRRTPEAEIEGSLAAYSMFARPWH